MGPRQPKQAPHVALVPVSEEHSSSSSEDDEPPELVSCSYDDEDDYNNVPGLPDLEEGCRQLELAPLLEPLGSWVHLGSVTLWRCADGTLRVVDGHHRIQALQDLHALLYPTVEDI